MSLEMVKNEEVGIKECREAIIASFAVFKLVYGIAKDGVQASDAWALMGAFFDYKFRNVLNEGIQGLNLVKKELQNLSAAEAKELWALVNTLFLEFKESASMSPAEGDKALLSIMGLFTDLRAKAENG